jgi:hypothetical protein
MYPPLLVLGGLGALEQHFLVVRQRLVRHRQRTAKHLARTLLIDAQQRQRVFERNISDAVGVHLLLRAARRHKCSAPAQLSESPLKCSI